MTSRRVVALALSVGWTFAACATSGTWVKRAGVGTGGTDWTSWTNTENWVDGILPSGYTDGEMPNLAAATGQYISIPEALDTTYIYSGLDYSASRPVVRCDSLVYLRNSSASSKNCGVVGAHLYAPWSLYASSSNYIRFWNSDICGSGSPQASKLQIDGTVKFRYDLYADSTNVVRKNESYTTGKSVSVYSSAHVYFIGPCGSSEPVVGRWSQTAGSPFLSRVGGEHVLPVGTIVTGEGIPDDTFLKRIFPDGTIELSQAATNTVADNALTFAARGMASYYAKGYEFSCFNGNYARNIYVLKHREEDDIRIEFKYWNCNNTADYRKVNVKSSSGYLPGTLVMGTGLGHYHYLTLETCHLEFAPSVDSSYPAGMINGHCNISGSAQVRMTVTNNISAVIGSVTNKTGTLTKDGAGTLTCGWGVTARNQNTASLVVEGGTFAPTGERDDMYVKNLTIKAGAKFVVPAAGFACETLTTELGAILDGRGTLVCDNVTEETIGNLTILGGGIKSNATIGQPLAIEPVSGKVSIEREGGDEIFIVGTNSLVKVIGGGTVDLLVVGGGGGGGHYSGGGGGGGGVVYRQSFQLDPGYYYITVGAGGIGSYTRTVSGDTVKLGTNGGESWAFSVMAAGGGLGGGYGTTLAGAKGSNGASGGGGGTPYFNASTYPNTGHAGGSGIDGQGYAGGVGTNGTTHTQQIGGGGGGAGGPGEDGVMSVATLSGGNGGPGRLCTIYGNQYYGGGGGSGAMSGRTSGGKGGIGGGGDGSTTDGSTIKSGKDGMENTGGGGGGAGGYTMGAPSVRTKGGNGGSGVVIIRYARAPRTDGEHERNFAVGGAVKIRGVYEVHKFLDSGTLVIPEDAVADILVVGGGGGGGCGRAGGGGAGGVVLATNRYLFAGTYTVTVGDGGVGATRPEGRGGNGGFSSFDGVSPVASVYAYGGGGGGSMTTRAFAGADGGSGGGGGAGLYSSGASSKPGGLGVDGQGHAGGSSTNTTDHSVSYAGGGGGAAEPGTSAVIGSSTIYGDGGDGIWIAGFDGNGNFYGGGGGGGSSKYLPEGTTYLAKGGAGGGGRGGGGGYINSTGRYYPGEDGTDGLGGGGGGGGAFGTSYTAAGGKGGSGVVFVRFRVPPRGAVFVFR